MLSYNHKYYEKNKEKHKKSMELWRLTNHGQLFKYRLNMRYEALLKIQKKIICVRCGCTDIRFLEINHKYGGGGREAKLGLSMGTQFYNKILTGKRKTDDLELLCRPCNHIHYLEWKYGEKIPLKVKWNPQPELDIRNFAWVRVK